jgi:hypothetical protein
MKRFFWVSQHPYLPSQLAELRRLFGEVEIVQDPRPFSSAEDIVARYRKGNYDEMIVVAPLSVLGKIVELGIRPLWADMQLVSLAQAEVSAKGRGYRFVRFRRVIKLTLEFEDL